MENKISINFNEVKVTDLGGNTVIVEDFVKITATAIYFSAPTIDLIEKARELNKGSDVELEEKELQFLITLFHPEDGKKVFFPFAQVPLWEYLKSKLPVVSDGK